MRGCRERLRDLADFIRKAVMLVVYNGAMLLLVPAVVLLVAVMLLTEPDGDPPCEWH